MQLIVCPGFHSPELTASFLRGLHRRVSPTRLWVWPISEAWGSVPWLLSDCHGLRKDMWLHIIGFSAGVVASYPLALAWQSMGGKVRLIAMDGWGMPLVGGQSVYRMSHDRYTHLTTCFPSPGEGKGYFYAEPAIDHLSFWRAPHAVCGVGALDGVVQPMTALDFMATVLTPAVHNSGVNIQRSSQG